ncbi:TetR/AcrR family transcriptional regulator [Actinosynnema pretiosum subsp. pretiosum]|uniref:TetR/AcrR family transcriptional regulator n=1 Tax=Actinosynnema pretiosum subsp. pretiosum TaxID=103721 RepID=A0AA45LAW4_9PSEU|nr:TetR/AcrR family transcriptional regulator [Actinosynnema mirum]QUF06417.1 TetR/AcrR family transcriptional regulator [Actinosynnema pretiosum subsp. pretiosum]
MPARSPQDRFVPSSPPAGSSPGVVARADGGAASAVRPRRADARRNHDRIARAAVEAFGRRGPEGPRLEDVAALAGVGVATVYRLFGDRDGVLRAAFELFFAERVTPLVLEARAGSDPGAGLRLVVAGAVEAFADHRSLVVAAKHAALIEPETLDRLLGEMADLLLEAQRLGQVRDDVVVGDLGGLLMMALAVSQLPDRLRNLALLWDGLRPGGSALPTPEGCRHPSAADGGVPPA